jgi:hypothetical protein
VPSSEGRSHVGVTGLGGYLADGHSEVSANYGYLLHTNWIEKFTPFHPHFNNMSFAISRGFHVAA